MRKLKELPESINGVEVVCDLGMNNQVPKKRIAKFKCNCGNTFIARVNAVKVGHKKSCGCIKSISNSTHGLSKHPLYRKWSGMITRTGNKKERCYHRYGGRGIKICEEWRNDFIKFYEWSINNGWKEGLTIDRIDNNGNYEPSNCQWITMYENTVKDQIKFKPTDEQKIHICNMYLRGEYTIRKLAKIFNTHRERISNILKENDIEIIHRRSKNVTKNTTSL